MPFPDCDEEMLHVLQQLLKQNSNAIDVGCNRGGILQEFVRLAPVGKHFAFEAIPDLFQSLTLRFPQVSCHNIAVSDETGSLAFHHFEEVDGFSGMMRRDIGRDPGVVREITVQVDRLDNLIPNDVDIDLIKIDVEGAELLVLRGASDLIQRCRPTIIFECGKGGLDLYGNEPEDVYALLDSHGYSVRLLTDWSETRPRLSGDDFALEFHKNIEYDFVASPN